MVIKKISFVILMEQRKKIFLLIFTKSQKNFVKISKKNGVMQKPATHRKSDFTVLSFFYVIYPFIRAMQVPEIVGPWELRFNQKI